MFTTFESFISTCRAYAALDEEERLALDYIMEDDEEMDNRIKGLNYSDLSAIKTFFAEVPSSIPDAAGMYRQLKEEQARKRFGEDAP